MFHPEMRWKWGGIFKKFHPEVIRFHLSNCSIIQCIFRAETRRKLGGIRGEICKLSGIVSGWKKNYGRKPGGNGVELEVEYVNEVEFFPGRKKNTGGKQVESGVEYANEVEFVPGGIFSG